MLGIVVHRAHNVYLEHKRLVEGHGTHQGESLKRMEHHHHKHMKSGRRSTRLGWCKPSSRHSIAYHGHPLHRSKMHSTLTFLVEDMVFPQCSDVDIGYSRGLLPHIYWNHEWSNWHIREEALVQHSMSVLHNCYHHTARRDVRISFRWRQLLIGIAAWWWRWGSRSTCCCGESCSGFR